MDFFYSSICHVCKNVNTDLRRCASCKFVAYCSKSHQVCDWKNHKQICKHISEYTKSNKLDEHCGYSTWRFYRLKFKFHLEQKLGRRLLSNESQMWMFPRHCSVCYSSELLKDCNECFCVAYCSIEHKTLDKKRHSMFCPELKLCLELDRYQITNPGIEIIFKEVNPNVECLPNSIHESIELFLEVSELNYMDKVLATDIFASILTVVYGLEMCNCLSKRNILKGSLVLHLVGADISELSLNWVHITHFLELWIKNLITCEIILVGPDLKCEPRKLLSNNKIKFHYFNDVYHNVVDTIQKPDIIIAFNSGLHECQFVEVNDSWNKSLSKLIKNNAPLLLTAYTRSEIEEDLKRFNNFNISHILSARKMLSQI
ncbi:hypothetical protein WA026_022679 [Henosepilachna vigintioctopunctata]|uniref:MYND-type domain-containing protein n=1 Tax=Henosepilachna vigintioctopunctata TaxID=420089 RepID=A0AAW1TXL0_9CUCU